MGKAACVTNQETERERGHCQGDLNTSPGNWGPEVFGDGHWENLSGAARAGTTLERVEEDGVEEAEAAQRSPPCGQGSAEVRPWPQGLWDQGWVVMMGHLRSVHKLPVHACPLCLERCDP